MNSHSQTENWNKQIFLERMMQNHDLARTVLTVFIEDIPLLFKEIKASTLQLDFDMIISAAHNLKGAADNVTAKKLAMIAEKIERAALNTQKEKIIQLIPVLEKELEKVILIFKVEVETYLGR